MNTEPFSQIGQVILLCSELLSVRGIWLYVLVLPRTRLIVTPNFIVAWMWNDTLFEEGQKSEV